MVISRVQRQKRKYITVVVGLDTVPDLKIKDAAKVFGRKFSSGSSGSETASGVKEVVIQGDVGLQLPALLMGEFKVCYYFICITDYIHCSFCIIYVCSCHRPINRCPPLVSSTWKTDQEPL